MQQAQPTPLRKQAAPSNSTVTQQALPYFTSVLPDTSELSDAQFIQWGHANPATSNDSFGPLNTQFSAPSNQLIRRSTNQQVATSNQSYSAQNHLDGLMDTSDGQIWESNEDLEKRAAAAKKDSQSRSPPKNIPPFIQKLSK